MRSQVAAAPRKRVAEDGRIRVLVVDDSVVARRLIVRALEADPAFDLVGFAADGEQCLSRVRQLRPDVVTLDIEMPGMDGLTTLRRLRQEFPDLCVIMFSALTERGAAVTLDALLLGADDYVAKTAHASVEDAVQALRSELLSKIKQFFVSPTPNHGTMPGERQPFGDRWRGSPVASAPSTARVLVIGSSTGGPCALADFFGLLPRDFPLPVLVVQHMPAAFTRLLAQRLQHYTPLHVEEGRQGAEVRRGRVLLAPGDFHMTVVRDGAREIVALDQSPAENSCRPSVDVLFRSVRHVYRGEAMAVILTGMGKDGLAGCRELKACGVPILVQDEASSVVWGMPGAVIGAGLADEIASPSRLAAAVLERLGRAL